MLGEGIVVAYIKFVCTVCISDELLQQAHRKTMKKPGEGCMLFPADAGKSIHQKREVPLCRRPVFKSSAMQSKVIKRIWYYLLKRSTEKSSTGWRVVRSLAKSARISPITLPNLKPWPEQGEAIITCSCCG